MTQGPEHLCAACVEAARPTERGANAYPASQVALRNIRKGAIDKIKKMKKTLGEDSVKVRVKV